MFSACLWLLFWWNPILLSNLVVPEFSQSVSLATVSNLSFSSIQIGRTHGALNSTEWSVSIADPSYISCSVDMKSGLIKTRVTGKVTLEPGGIAFIKENADECGRSETNILSRKCELNLRVTSITLDPPNALLNVAIKMMKNFIEKKINQAVCNQGLPAIENALLNPTIKPVAAHPVIIAGATPLENSPLIRSLVNVVNNLPIIFSIHLKASIHAGTTLRLQLDFTKGAHFSLGKEGGQTALPVEQILDKLMDVLKFLHLESMRVMISELLLQMSEGAIEGAVPHSFSGSMDVTLHDLRCDATGFICTIPRVNGVQVQNIRTEQLGEWDRIIANYADPFLGILIGDLINRTISEFNEPHVTRVTIPPGKETEVKRKPPILFSVLLFLGAVCIFAIGIFFSFWCHRKAPVLGIDGLPISLRRVIVEDTILLLMGLTAVFLFAWSNAATAATLEMGGELELLSFSLMETTCNLYNAGLKPLAILVFLFSGIYPYLKILAILVWTLVLQKPSSTILKLVDYFGKFSFLDSFAMVIMASGLQVVGIAEVKILPGFYVFLSATILSILMGNYATALWRRNTALRVVSPCNEPVPTASPANHNVERNVIFSDQSDTPLAEKTSIISKRRVLLASLNGLFVACCVIPAWVVPCLRYRVTGMASMILQEERNMTLYELSSLSPMLLITCVLTVIIAPVFHAVMYPKWSLLASWSAADALLLACVAGLLQIGQFIEFVVGKGFEELYYAEADLLWPLLPLLISVIWQWTMTVVHVFGFLPRIKRCFP